MKIPRQIAVKPVRIVWQVAPGRVQVFTSSKGQAFAGIKPCRESGPAFSAIFMSSPETTRRENWILTGIFVAALCFHFYGVTLNWKAPFMSGHEFRQAQTAITTYYIDQQNNFSLLYETPILGKPWVSILMEVPVYEWSVVLLSRAAGLPPFHGGAHGIGGLFLSDAASDLPPAGAIRPVAAPAVALVGPDPDLSRLHLLFAGVPDGVDGADVLRLVPARVCADHGRAALVVARPDHLGRHRGGADQECHAGGVADAGRRLWDLDAVAGS